VTKSYWRIFLEAEANWQSNYISKLPSSTNHAGWKQGMLSVTFFLPNCAWELTERVAESKSMLGTVRTV